MSVDDRAAVPHRKKPRLLEPSRLVCCLCWSKGDCWQQLRKTPASSADPVVHEVVVIAAGVAECGIDLNGAGAASPHIALGLQSITLPKRAVRHFSSGSDAGLFPPAGSKNPGQNGIPC